MIEQTKGMKKFFHAFKCEMKRECLPLGKVPQEACGKWSVKTSKYNLGENPHLKATCPCGRSLRLNTHGKVHTYESREAAELMCDILNKEAGL